MQGIVLGKYPIKFYFKLFFLHLRINGLRWTLCFTARHVLAGSLRRVEKISHRLEKKYALPGSNSVMENALKWNHYSWKRGEEEWTKSEQWKDSVIEHVMLESIPPDCVVLEIGPGFGRWTRKLIEISRHLVVVDVAEKCITHCKKVFGDKDNVEFHVNDGRSLAFVDDDSIDYVWSFDVLVHIEPKDVDHYLQEFQRILKEDGVVILHHGAVGKTDFGWRSSLTLQIFSDFLERSKFKLVRQFNSWGDNDEFSVASSDTISIFRKSARV